MEVCHRSVQGGVPESHSWMTARAQEMSQKIGSWSPEGLPEDGLGSMTNSQVEITKTTYSTTSFLILLDFSQRTFVWFDSRLFPVMLSPSVQTVVLFLIIVSACRPS